MNKLTKLFTITLTLYLILSFSGLTSFVFAIGDDDSSSTSSSKSSSSSSSKVSTSRRSSRSSSRSSISRSSSSSSSRENELEPLRLEVKNVEDSLKESNSALAAYKAAKSAEKLAKLKELGLKIVNERISFLQNRLTTKVQNEKNLSNTAKSELILMINEVLTQLNTEKTTIEEATELEELKGLVRGIYEDYRIYAVFAPKFYVIFGAYKLDYLNDKLNTVLAKIEVRVEENKDTLTNYDEIKELIESAKTSLATSQTQLESAISQAKEALPAKDTTQAKQSIEKGRASLSQAKASLNKVKDYVKQISSLLVKKTTSKSSVTSSEAGE